MLINIFKSWKFFIGLLLAFSLIYFRFIFTKKTHMVPFPLSSYRLFTSAPANIVEDIYIAVYSIDGKKLDKPQDIFQQDLIDYNKHQTYLKIQKLPALSREQKIFVLKEMKEKFFPHQHLTVELRERSFEPEKLYLESKTMTEKSLSGIISL